MKTYRLLSLVLIFLLLAACSKKDPTPLDVARDQDAPPTTIPQLMPTVVPQETEAQDAPASAEPENQAPPVSEEPSAMPATTLLDTAWDDRQIFRSSLIAGQQDVLDSLADATVYHMNLTIEEPTVVSGQMQVRYTNQEDIALDEIYFHLYPGQLGGSISISDVTVNGSVVQPDMQETAMRLPLETALDPGQSAVIQMAFSTKVPVEESTKYNILAFMDDILALAHFYPMVAVYDDQGWHVEPSPANGDETFADMSHYLVQVTAPAEQVIVTSGVELDRSQSAGTQTVTFAAGAVRDFYLAMSERYEVVSEKVGPVQINSYAPPELLRGANVALGVASHALSSYNERFGEYPYSELDIISTPTSAGGVEYPGIFAVALRIYDISSKSPSGTPNIVLLETTTAHEAAHQWFYNLVGSDQLNEPWLDEATAQYATWMYFIDRYGKVNATGEYRGFRSLWEESNFAEIPIGMPADAYSSIDYEAIIYGRGPIFLDELAQEMGQDTFDAFLLDYNQTYRWKIAGSEDFQLLAEQHCQCDLAALFDEVVYPD